MAQISLYVTEPELQLIESAAAREKTSISKWVISKALSNLDSTYPPGYENLIGSIKDDSFTRPRQMSFSKDVKRESL